jgi:hypothetical protein
MNTNETVKAIGSSAKHVIGKKRGKQITLKRIGAIKTKGKQNESAL